MKTKRPAHLGQAIAELVWLIGKRLNGPRPARTQHVRRMKAIIRYAYRRYQIGPHQLGIKHLRAFLDYTWQRDGVIDAEDYFPSVYQLVWLLGKAHDWLPRLYGPWGRPVKKGQLPRRLQSERAPTPGSGAHRHGRAHSS
ncbi:MAG: hypothetical protein ACYC9L_09925 [Sulfuricaulis sp.]